MSILKQTLDISPDKYRDKEAYEVKGIDCPRCHGQGGSSEQTGHDEYHFTPCDFCGGAKKVKATITIEWNPDFGA